MGILTKLSGQVTVTTAGTAVQGNVVSGKVFSFQAHPDNTDTAWIGNDGADDVTGSNGFPLNPVGPALILLIDDLSDLWFDADVSGEKVCWIRIAA